MKPEDLKLPFTWANPVTMVQDRVWYVTAPPDKTDFRFPGWSDPLLFGNEQPVFVEYCSGNGAWIAEKAQLHPEVNWVAVERKFARVRKIWSKIKNLQLSNLLVLCGEAHHATRCYFPCGQIAEIYINFPDPWPKNRHAKNRLVQLTFAHELYRVMREQAQLNFVTDDPAHSNWFLRMMRSHGMFHSAYEAPFYRTQLADYGSSYFDQLWRSKAREIRYHQFIKKNS